MGKLKPANYTYKAANSKFERRVDRHLITRHYLRICKKTPEKAVPEPVPSPPNHLHSAFLSIYSSIANLQKSQDIDFRHQIVGKLDHPHIFSPKFEVKSFGLSFYIYSTHYFPPFTNATQNQTKKIGEISPIFTLCRKRF